MPLQKKRVRKSSLKRLVFRNDDDVREESMKSNEGKNVQFSTIEVRDYSLCLGDHPGVNRGAPVSLDWEYLSEQSFDLEEYEQRSFGREKKSHNAMIRQAFERNYVLRKLGYTEDEIKTRSKSVRQDQKNRSQTRRAMIFEPFMIMSEETKRWISKRKSLRDKIDDESNKSMRDSSRDSVVAASTASEMSSSYHPSSTFMTESNVIVCSQ